MKLEEDNGMAEARRNILEKINEEKERRVTARVKGVLKKMNKTYGGSIINESEMTEQTGAKFRIFLKNMKIEQSKAKNYRIFVPFNI